MQRPIVSWTVPKRMTWETDLFLVIKCYIQVDEYYFAWWRKVAGFGRKFLSTQLGKPRI